MIDYEGHPTTDRRQFFFNSSFSALPRAATKAVRGGEPKRPHGGNPSGPDADNASAGGFDRDVIFGIVFKHPSLTFQNITSRSQVPGKPFGRPQS